MEVIGAGFGRTGTMSLKAALERLGVGPCYHAIELFDKPERAGLWEAAARGERVDWGELLAGYRSTVDWPACAFYEQLADAFPHAPVLLSVRDPERWYDSVAATIYGIRHGGQPVAGMPEPEEMPPDVRRAREALDRIVFADTFSDRFEDREYAIDVFERHNEQVRRRIAPDRLLVYEVGRGGTRCAPFSGWRCRTSCSRTSTTARRSRRWCASAWRRRRPARRPIRRRRVEARLRARLGSLAGRLPRGVR